MAYEIGDPNHIEVHNALVADVQSLATGFGVDVVLPDTANVGDTGHVSDHNLIVAALQAIADAPSEGMSWAKVSGGTVTEYTKADGSVMEVHTFTADGTLTVDTPGYAEVLLVGGGSGIITGVTQGGGGDTDSGMRQFPTGSHPVTIGEGGTVSGSFPTSLGRPSSIGSVCRTGYGFVESFSDAAPSTGSDRNTPVASSISGVARTYAAGAGLASSTGYGDGVTNAAGWAGVVIVAVQKSAPTVSGVVASGGTETTYVGDGVNGVLGQTYKVHTFYESGTLTVSSGGEVDVLLVGGAGINAGGDGGQVGEWTLNLSAQSLPVVVGPTASASAALRTYIGDGKIGVSGATANGTYGGGGRLPTAVSGQEGVFSSITGTSIQYGGGIPANSTAASKGVGGMNGAGSTNVDTKGRGVAIFRYKVVA